MKHSKKALAGLQSFVDEEKSEKRKTKPQGKGIVKALGQKSTTGNFAKIAKAKGKGAAIGALQNKLAKHQGKPIPYGNKKRPTPGKGNKAAPQADKQSVRVNKLKTQGKSVNPTKAAKASSSLMRKKRSTPSAGSKNPFGNLGKSESPMRNKRVYANILSKTSTQNKMTTADKLKRAFSQVKH